MTPPLAPPKSRNAHQDRAAAVSFCVTTLLRRADFLRAARGPRVATPGFILQARKRVDRNDTCVRVGFTCSKKVGNAVARNTAKRRLREIARRVIPTHGQPGFDYVLIGRARTTAQRPFTDLLRDLQAALHKLHGSGQ